MSNKIWTKEELQPIIEKFKKNFEKKLKPNNRLKALPKVSDLLIYPSKNLKHFNNRNTIETDFTTIFQFDFRSGANTYTNFGEMRNPNIDYSNSVGFTYIAKIFDGKSAVLVNWVDSNYITNDISNVNKFIGHRFIGWTKLAKIISRTSNADISPVAGNDEYIGIQSEEDIVLQFGDIGEFEVRNAETMGSIDEKITNWDDYQQDREETRLYLMPELSPNKLFFISEHTAEKNNNKTIHTIKFSSLRDKLQKSGRALEQYVNYGLTIGGAYAFPEVKLSNGILRTISLNKKALNVLPITHCVLEVYGNNAFGNVMFMGRPVKNRDDFIVEATRLITPEAPVMDTPTYTLNKGNVETLNYFLTSGSFIANAWDNDWWKQESGLNNQMLATQQLDSQGQLILGEPIKPTDPITIPTNELPLYNPNWKPLTELVSPDLKISINTSYYAQKFVQYDINDNWSAINFKNFLVQNQYVALTPTAYHTLNVSIGEIPVLGKIFGLLGIGNYGWSDDFYAKVLDLKLFIECSVYNCFNLKNLKQTAGNTKDALLLSVFNNTDDTTKLFGQSAKKSVFAFTLTDRVVNQADATDIKPTIEAGQRFHENGTPIKPDETKWNIGNKYVPYPKEDTTYGYEIDAIWLQLIGMCDCRITFYNKNKMGKLDPVWASSFQTQSKFSGSILDWTTYINTNGFDNEIMFEEEPTTYPHLLDIDGSCAHDLGDNLDITGQIKKNYDFNLANTGNAEIIEAIVGEEIHLDEQDWNLKLKNGDLMNGQTINFSLPTGTNLNLYKTLRIQVGLTNPDQQLVKNIIEFPKQAGENFAGEINIEQLSGFANCVHNMPQTFVVVLAVRPPTDTIVFDGHWTGKLKLTQDGLNFTLTLEDWYYKRESHWFWHWTPAMSLGDSPVLYNQDGGFSTSQVSFQIINGSFIENQNN